VIHINTRFIPKKRLQVKKTTTEAKLEQSFVKLLNMANITNIKGNAIGVKGFPDRIVFADTIYYVELKVGKELGSYYTQTPKQKEWQEIIEKSNGKYILLVGEESIKNFVKELKEKTLVI
jgi:CRISPR/Cas system CMR subunit Cmr4 (Cas7 group RAMP superfamily)